MSETSFPSPFLFAVAGSKRKVRDSLMSYGDALHQRYGASVAHNALAILSLAIQRAETFDCEGDPSCGVKVDIAMNKETIIIQTKPFRVILNPKAGVNCIEDTEPSTVHADEGAPLANEA